MNVKTTMSRDGQPRFTMYIEVRVGWQLMRDFLCRHLNRHFNFTMDDLPAAERQRRAEENTKLMEGLNSRYTILKMVRSELESDGRQHVAYWTDDVSEHRQEELQRMAEVLLERLFPELHPRHNRQPDPRT